MSVKSVAKTYCPIFLIPALKRIEASPNGTRLARGIFWSITGSFISRGMMLCSTVLVARILGKTVYGELGMIQSTVEMFGVFAGFGMGLTATKHVAEFRQSDPERAGRIIGLSGFVAIGAGGLMALVLWIFAPWLAEETINAPHLSGVIRIGSIILYISALIGAQTGALAGFEAFKTIAHVNLFVGLISFPLLVLGSRFWGLTGAVWAMAINRFIHWLLNHIALRGESRRFCVPFSFQNSSLEMPILWRFALPTTLAGLMVGPVNWVCRAILTNHPNGYEEIGVLTAALVFQGLLMSISNMLSAPLLSMVSHAGENISIKLTAVNILSTWILGVIIAIPFLCLPEVASLVFGKDFATNRFHVTFLVVVFYTCILTFRSGLYRVLVSRSLNWLGLVNNIVWAAILIPLAWYLSSWGAVGLSISFGIAYAGCSVIFVPLYVKYGKVSKQLFCSKEVVMIWIVLCGILILSIMKISILIRILIIPTAYFVMFFAFRALWNQSKQ